jgi:nicotinamide riboside kinase
MGKFTISISGTGSVGKSTLLQALKLDERFNGICFVEEVTRQVHSQGLPINEEASDDTQLAIAAAHRHNIEKVTGSTILDRSMLDCLAYSIYMQERGQITLGALSTISRMWQDYRAKIDLYVYIPIEFPAVADGVRSTGEDFRNRVDEIIKLLILDQTAGSAPRPIFALTGSVEARVNKLSEIIHILNTKE